MTNHIKIQMDCCGDLNDVLGQVFRSHEDVFIRLVSEAGPGGGWPVVELLGQPADVSTVLGDVWGCTQSEANELIEYQAE